MKKRLKNLDALIEIIKKNIASESEREKALAIAEDLQQLAFDVEDDINEISEKYGQALAANDFFRSALNALPNPIFIKNGLGEFIYFNQQYEKYFNMSKEKYYNKTVLDLEYLSPEDRERYQNEDLALIRDGRVAHYETTFDLGDGETSYALYWSSGFVSDVWRRRGLIGEIVDISTEKRLKNQIEKSVEELETANQKIESLMKHDFLTGLYNRRIMNDFLFKDNNKKEKINASFLLADLDLFKRVNDTYGHLVGDDILVKIAKIMQASCRKDDYVIRYGGEEFLIVFFNTLVENVALIAERIRNVAENELLLPDGKTVTVSIGISQMKPGESMERCISRVDSALYEAKQTGRNRVVIKK